MIIKTLEITLTGMSIVFIFFSLLVIVVKISSSLINSTAGLFPEKNGTGSEISVYPQDAGKVLRMLFKIGSDVKKDDILLTVETEYNKTGFVYFPMKEEKSIKSPVTGKISKACCSEGDVIDNKTPLYKIKTSASIAGDGNLYDDSIPSVKSPLPGEITSIRVNEGDTVEQGETVLTLEAMKMETDIKSDFKGKVTSIIVNTGDQVITGQRLIVLN